MEEDSAKAEVRYSPAETWQIDAGGSRRPAVGERSSMCSAMLSFAAELAPPFAPPSRSAHACVPSRCECEPCDVSHVGCASCFAPLRKPVVTGRSRAGRVRPEQEPGQGEESLRQVGRQAPPTGAAAAREGRGEREWSLADRKSGTRGTLVRVGACARAWYREGPRRVEACAVGSKSRPAVTSGGCARRRPRTHQRSGGSESGMSSR